MHDIWQTNFLQNALLFKPVIETCRDFFYQHKDWPLLPDYNQWLQQRKEKITNAAGIPIHFVPQQLNPKNFNEYYEPRIWECGEIQTREKNWHDFFNAMVWFIFPKTKAILNEQHCGEFKQRWQQSSMRTTLENILTLFDENGAIVVSSNPALIELLKNFQWRELFWRQRELVKQQMQCYLFGHSLYEKALNPYLGLTAKCVVFRVTQDFFQQTYAQQLIEIDNKLADTFKNHRITSKFQPLPILGLPDWIAENNCEKYYNNTQYFREKTNEAVIPDK